MASFVAEFEFISSSSNTKSIETVVVSVSITAPAASTLTASVTSARASMPESLVLSADVITAPEPASVISLCAVTDPLTSPKSTLASGIVIVLSADVTALTSNTIPKLSPPRSTILKVASSNSVPPAVLSASSIASKWDPISSALAAV